MQIKNGIVNNSLRVLTGLISDKIEAKVFKGNLEGNASSSDSATTLDGLTASVNELNYSAGLTGSIQHQLDSRGIGCYKRYSSLTLADGWYRIIRSDINIYRANSIISITASGPGHHTNVVFTMSSLYGTMQSSKLHILNATHAWAARAIDNIRVTYVPDNYSNRYTYIDIHIPISTNDSGVTVDLIDVHITNSNTTFPCDDLVNVTDVTEDYGYNVYDCSIDDFASFHNMNITGRIYGPVGFYDKDNTTTQADINNKSGLHMNNSYISGVDAIYMSDTVSNYSEGIHFLTKDVAQDDQAYMDTIYALGGELFFVPNRPVGNSTNLASGLHKRVYHEGHVPTLSELGVSATAIELNHSVGLTSNIQTQLNNKADGIRVDVSWQRSATPRWFRIAETPANINIVLGMFLVSVSTNGWHTGLIFSASTMYNVSDSASINVHESITYSSPIVTKIRMVQPKNYQGNKAYIDIYVEAVDMDDTAPIYTTIYNTLSHRWNVITPIEVSEEIDTTNQVQYVVELIKNRPVTGKPHYIGGDLTFYNKASIYDVTNTRSKLFTVDKRNATEASVMRVTDDHLTRDLMKWYTHDVNGGTLILASGGGMIIGSGESSSGWYDAAIADGTIPNPGHEYMYITSDNAIYLITNMQTAANKKIITLNNGTITGVTSISGNANTATALQTARSVHVDLASTTAASFNGSGNITPGVTGRLGVANGGLPPYSTANNNQVLMIVNGTPTWQTIPAV